MNIAVFGGSFDPFHIGHSAIVDSLKKLNYIDKTIVVPTYLNPFKKEFHLSPNDRYEIIKELYKDDKKVEVSDFEISLNTPTPTIKTINYLKSIYNPSKIYLVIGADNLKSLHKWDSFNLLCKLVEFIVVTRDGYEVKDDIINFKILNIGIDISSSSLREHFDTNYIPKQIIQKVTKIWNKELKE